MTLDVTKDISEKWGIVRSVLRNIRQAAQDVIATTAASDVSAEYIAFSVYRTFRDMRNQLADNLDPALDGYLTALRGIETTNFVAEANVVVASIDAMLLAIEAKASSMQVALTAPLDAVLTGTVVNTAITPAETQPLRDRLADLVAFIQV